MVCVAALLQGCFLDRQWKWFVAREKSGKMSGNFLYSSEWQLCMIYTITRENGGLKTFNTTANSYPFNKSVFQTSASFSLLNFSFVRNLQLRTGSLSVSGRVFRVSEARMCGPSYSWWMTLVLCGKTSWNKWSKGRFCLRVINGHALACRTGFFWCTNARLSKMAVWRKPVILSLGIMVWLAPSLCQCHHPRWRHSVNSVLSLADSNTPVLKVITS